MKKLKNVNIELLMNRKVNEFATSFELKNKRKRIVSYVKLIKMICEKSIIDSWSFNDLAKSYGMKYGIPITKQAIWNQVNNTINAFFQFFLAHLLSTYVYKKSSTEVISLFSRILIEDSTAIKIPAKFKSIFPGSGNQNGSNSVLKIQCLYDIISEKFINFKITPYTDNDQKMGGGILDHIKVGDICIRDMGYFAMHHFISITRRGADYISRVKFPIYFYDAQDNKIDLLKLFTDKKNCDINVFMGDLLVPVRLVALALPEAQANERRRKANSNRHKNYSKEYMSLLGWNFFITSIDKETLSPQQIVEMYSLRWRIESIFKMWKSYMDFTKFHKGISLNQLYIIIIARLIVVTLLHEGFLKQVIAKIERETKREVSYFQLYSLVAKNITEFVNIVFGDGYDLIESLIIQNCLYEKRPGRKNYTQLKTKCLGFI